MLRLLEPLDIYLRGLKDCSSLDRLERLVYILMEFETLMDMEGWDDFFLYDRFFERIDHIKEGIRMTPSRIEEEIASYVHGLAPFQQDEVLAFVRSLAETPFGVPGRDLLAFSSAFASEELDALQQAIEVGCEQVSSDEW